MSPDATPDTPDVFTATHLVESLERGAMTSAELVDACVQRVQTTHAAWTQFDASEALRQAQSMDEIRAKGRPTGSLHGLPVGVVDVLSPDVSNTVAVCERLAEAGSVVLGHAPGAVLAGAVAQMHVPIAVASLGAGEAMRDASHHGIYGFKPSRGVISRHGAKPRARSLAQVGVLGRTLQDVALLADALSGHDARDNASYLRPRPQAALGAAQQAPVAPNFVCLKLGLDDDCAQTTARGMDELLELLGGQAELLEASSTFAPLLAAYGVVESYECDAQHDAAGYSAALEVMDSAQVFLAEFFHDYDAIIAPSAYGEMADNPAHLPALSRIAALCGLPSVSLPLLEGATGLPVNLQLIGNREEDRRLVRAARWLIERINAA